METSGLKEILELMNIKEKDTSKDYKYDFNYDRHIYKYNLSRNTNVKDRVEQILDIQIQNDELILWAIINEKLPKTEFQFDIFGTGWELEEYKGIYLKTVQHGRMVWHIFLREGE